MGCNNTQVDAFQVNINEEKFVIHLDEDNKPIKVDLSDEPIIIKVTGGGCVQQIGGGGSGDFDPTLFKTENLSSQIDGIITDYTTPHNFYSQTLTVFLNGLVELDIIVLSNNSFRVSLPVLSTGDVLVARYVEDV